MPLAPLAEVVVTSMCFNSKGDSFLAEGRAEALLQVDEHLRNKLWINFVSLAGPLHEKEIKFLKCDHSRSRRRRSFTPLRTVTTLPTTRESEAWLSTFWTRKLVDTLALPSAVEKASSTL